MTEVTAPAYAVSPLYIRKLIEYPEALQVLEFAYGVRQGLNDVPSRGKNFQAAQGPQLAGKVPKAVRAHVQLLELWEVKEKTFTRKSHKAVVGEVENHEVA